MLVDMAAAAPPDSGISEPVGFGVPGAVAVPFVGVPAPFSTSPSSPPNSSSSGTSVVVPAAASLYFSIVLSALSLGLYLAGLLAILTQRW